MIVRAASSVEAPRLVEILVDAQARSRYAGKVAIDQPYARKYLATAIHRHGHTNEGGCFVQVAERKPGQIDGFICGALNRVYQVGDMLCAQDVFLIGRKDFPPRALNWLLDGYIAWALANRRVFEVWLSHSDVLPQGDRFGALFERKGFQRCGAMFRREAEVQAMGIAA